jgi:hypothetical protein
MKYINTPKFEKESSFESIEDDMSMSDSNEE